MPPWEPGAHVDLLLGNGLIRQYSLCGNPERRCEYRIGVFREPRGRGGSAFVHDTLGEGSSVLVRGPRNHFPLVDAARYLFVAGGIGLMPIVPMLAAANRAGADWTLLYSGRTRSSMALLDHLQATYQTHVRAYPRDERDRVDLDAVFRGLTQHTHVYCCGPDRMIRAVEDLARAHDVALHTERFAPRTITAEAPPEPFEIELVESGLTLTVPPDKTILQTVADAGIDVLSSCGEGTCGTCETVIVDGIADHRDSLLTDEEKATNETLMICVSRAAGPRLVLQL